VCGCAILIESKTNDAFLIQIAVIFRVYCADHTFCTLRFPIYTTAEVIKICAADKLQLNRGPEDLVLVEVKSNGERTVFKDNDLSIPTALTLNGRLFVSPKDHLDALTPLPEQEGATEGLEMDIEALATKDLAYHMTLFDWDLFWAVHEYELLYHTFGRHHFNKVSEACLFAIHYGRSFPFSLALQMSFN